ncbi:hypothetical protein CN918_26480 [Priestia megaterium]|nr:hypothetical protein CN918_26480 [Priestia megaterium]
MKKWLKILMVVLVITNVITLSLWLVKQNELKYIKNLDNMHSISFSGTSNEWELSGGLLVVAPNMYMIKGGNLSYVGDKTLKVKQLNIEMAFKKKDGTVDDAFASGEDYQNTEPETIKKGYKNELGSTTTTLSIKEFKEWKKESKHQPMTISILYMTADGKEHKTEISTVIN